MIETTKYVRKPLFVDAVRVTQDNFRDVAEWCMGTIEHNDPNGVHARGIDPNSQHIKVRTHNPRNVRQSQAYVGDWILYTERGYKVYTDKAFKAGFDKVDKKKLTIHNNILPGSQVSGE